MDFYMIYFVISQNVLAHDMTQTGKRALNGKMHTIACVEPPPLPASVPFALLCVCLCVSGA